MRLLLDTHALIWYALLDPKLSPHARALIADPANTVYVSVATFWEMAIKISLGKLTLQASLEDFIDLCLGRDGFRLLPIEPAHLIRLTSLPYPTGHKDPFDRLLIAQAAVEGIPIVGGDIAFDHYPIQRVW